MEHIRRHQQQFVDNLAKSFVSNEYKLPEGVGAIYTLEAVNLYKNDLQKALGQREITQEDFEKGMKDLSRLAQRKVTDKNGHQRIVYVKVTQDEKGQSKEQDFEQGHHVKFTKDGKEHVGKIHSLKFNEKTDKVGTASVDVDGTKHSVSLAKLEHRDEKESKPTTADLYNKIKNGAPKQRNPEGVIHTKDEPEKTLPIKTDVKTDKDYKDMAKKMVGAAKSLPPVKDEESDEDIVERLKKRRDLSSKEEREMYEAQDRLVTKSKKDEKDSLKGKDPLDYPEGKKLIEAIEHGSSDPKNLIPYKKKLKEIFGYDYDKGQNAESDISEIEKLHNEAKSIGLTGYENMNKTMLADKIKQFKGEGGKDSKLVLKPLKITPTGNTGGQAYHMQQKMKKVLEKLGGEWEVSSGSTTLTNHHGEKIAAISKDKDSPIKEIESRDLTKMLRSGGNEEIKEITIITRDGKSHSIEHNFLDGYVKSRDDSDKTKNDEFNAIEKQQGGNRGVFLSHHTDTIEKIAKDYLKSNVKKSVSDEDIKKAFDKIGTVEVKSDIEKAFEKVGTFRDDLEKGKKLPIGTVTNGYKKVAEGKWQKVSTHGMTKNEHKDELSKITKQNLDAYHSRSGGQDVIDKNKPFANKHKEGYGEVDDKHYDDAHVLGEDKTKKFVSGTLTHEVAKDEGGYMHIKVTGKGFDKMSLDQKLDISRHYKGEWSGYVVKNNPEVVKGELHTIVVLKKK